MVVSDDPVVAAAQAMLDEIHALRADMAARPASDMVAVPKVLVGLSITLLAAACIGLYGIAMDVHSIEATRFTREDGERMRTELIGYANRIRAEIMEEVPTPDTQRRLTDHERRLERIEGR